TLARALHFDGGGCWGDDEANPPRRRGWWNDLPPHAHPRLGIDSAGPVPKRFGIGLRVFPA
ncbi:MAG: hypothetical protein N3A53_05410, partial [Verrucomicrobiae bacterium]|nr:hypothetical protein [Verrucomicrobiae bacterium]